MAATSFSDGATGRQDAVRLRVAVYDTLAAAAGYRSPEAQAAWHGIARSRMYQLRSGGSPQLTTAMRMAADLGVAVEVIWERVTTEVVAS